MKPVVFLVLAVFLKGKRVLNTLDNLRQVDFNMT